MPPSPVALLSSSREHLPRPAPSGPLFTFNLDHTRSKELFVIAVSHYSVTLQGGVKPGQLSAILSTIFLLMNPRIIEYEIFHE